MPTLDERVTALEAALAERSTPSAPPGDWWLLDTVRDRHPDGAIAFGGTASVGAGEAAWQWEQSSADVLQQDWGGTAARFDALAHPVRLRLLQLVLTGTSATADLAADPGIGTTGQLHHHLRALVAGGWLASAGRARWVVPAPRVIPLLVVVSATAS